MGDKFLCRKSIIQKYVSLKVKVLNKSKFFLGFLKETDFTPAAKLFLTKGLAEYV